MIKKSFDILSKLSYQAIVLLQEIKTFFLFFARWLSLAFELQLLEFEESASSATKQ